MAKLLKFLFTDKNTLLTDEKLVEGCLGKERSYQELLYKKFAAKMMGVCLGYTKDKDAAKDLLQEAFIKVFNNISNYNGQGSLEGWIRRIVVNTAIDQYRKENKLYVSNIEKETPPSVDNSILEQVNSEELLQLIRKLPEGYRMVFNLYAVEGYSHEEIADQLKITESTSRSQLARARKLLQEWITELTQTTFFIIHANEG